MAATTEAIRRWLTRGKERGATHVIIVSDDFEGEYYPDYVMPGQDVRALEQACNGKDMQRVVEIYNLTPPLKSNYKNSGPGIPNHFSIDLPDWNSPCGSFLHDVELIFSPPQSLAARLFALIDILHTVHSYQMGSRTGGPMMHRLHTKRVAPFQCSSNARWCL